MKLTISKSKNSEQLYICKSYRNASGKSTSKIVEKLGTMEELLPLHDNDREQVIMWGREKAKEMTQAEKKSSLEIAIKVSEKTLNDKDKEMRFNCGYLFLKKLYHELKLDDICKEIQKQYKTEYNLSEILEMLIYTRILYPTSKRASFEHAQKLLAMPSYELHDIYRALDILQENSDEIQSALYKNSLDVIERDKSVLFYDCTNFFFEIEEEKGMRKYGRSKEHRPNPIIQMGLFTDGNGIPLAMTLFDGNKNEQPSMVPLEKKLVKDFGMSDMVICTDAGLSSNENRKFNSCTSRNYVTTQSIKKLKGFLKEWALNPEGWHIGHSSDKRVYNLNDLDSETHKNTVFYKERWINENGIEQRLIVTYSLKYKLYQECIRKKQIERAEKIVESNKKDRPNPNSASRFVKKQKCTTDGEIANKTVLSLNQDKIDNESLYDGFYAVCTSLRNEANTILNINHRRWQIEAAFRVMKTEFKSRPVFLQRDERISAHFLTCYIALLLYRILEAKLENTYTTSQIIETLRNMQLHHVEGFGYLSSYKRTDLTDILHEKFCFRTDNQFISNKSLKKILRCVTKL